ncbi:MULTISPECIES: hypothetical protein [unclassified Microcoleus]|uniref:hypothetical protein n=1 Tax=unclassified Microcoleus TaxID=2642155 RepID=UPI002FCF22C1
MTASCSSLFGWAHNQAQGWRSPTRSSFGEPKTPLLGKMGLSRDPLNLPPNYKSHTIKLFKCHCYNPKI